jgi:hypothetical protein
VLRDTRPTGRKVQHFFFSSLFIVCESLVFSFSLSHTFFNRGGTASFDGETSFLDLQITYDPDIARNGNMGSKWAYFVLARSFLTGLNGAFFVMFFRICNYWAYNRE